MLDVCSAALAVHRAGADPDRVHVTATTALPAGMHYLCCHTAAAPARPSFPPLSVRPRRNPQSALYGAIWEVDRTGSNDYRRFARSFLRMRMSCEFPFPAASAAAAVYCV